MYRIGCDVGGTNTDAAILDTTKLDDASRGVLATHKTATTPNVTDGIKSAIETILQKSQVSREHVLNVAIGTTHFVNAVVENDARHLQRVAVVRLCGPYTRQNPPFSDYPYALRDIIEGPIYYLKGGLEVDGREICPLDENEIRQTAREITEAGIHSVALVGIFSALDHDGKHEQRCKQLMTEECPSLSIVCSAAIGGPGFLVRENSTILNAAILSFARKTIRGFRQAIQALDLKCPLFLTQNDGTLIDATAAAELPVRTFASGPTNSLMGAAFLQNIRAEPGQIDRQLLVVDVGGTTTDVCALLPSGFPRKASSFVEVGGVRTAFSMPEVYSVGVGGGSRIRSNEDDTVTVGPDSVAYRLTSEALVFGGKSLTTTDIAVASKIASIGDAGLVNHLSASFLERARQEINRIVQNAIDQMKVSSGPATVILVGGGSIIVGNNLEGVSECLRPPHHDSANAVGAAIANIAGEVDTIAVLSGQDEDDVLNQIKERAIEAAVQQGADRSTVYIADISKVPLQYVANNTVRFVVKAVGKLDAKLATKNVTATQEDEQLHRTEPETYSNCVVTEPNKTRLGSMATPCLNIELTTYRPKVQGGVWYISAIDVDLIATGCGVLGTGGGGSSYDMALYVYDVLQKVSEGTIRVMPPSSLKDSDICCFGSGYGAPSVGDERVSSGQEVIAAVEELNKISGFSDFSAVVADEIGGGNGLVTFPTGAHFNKPVVDCDLMGRAYPTAEHVTPCVHGFPLIPCSIADSSGNVSIITKAASNTMVEQMLRMQCTVMGSSAAAASRPLSGAVIKKYAIPNTVSQAWFLGRAVRLAKQTKTDFIEAINKIMPVKLLYTGKILDVTRDVSKGYTVGRCVLAPLSVEERGEAGQEQTEKRNLIIPFQNEYLAAYFESVADQSDREVLCTVPDLISILDQDGEALGSPDLRYGLQVKVIGMPAHPLWTGSAEGLRIGGPEFFNLDMPWTSIGEYKLPRSVFEEFDG